MEVGARFIHFVIEKCFRRNYNVFFRFKAKHDDPVYNNIYHQEMRSAITGCFNEAEGTVT
jgi:hypothetical protein